MSRRLPSSIDFSGGLTLRNRTLFGDYRKFYQNVYPQRLQPGERTWWRSAGYNNRNNRTNLFSQTDLVWENRLGGIDQTLLFGFEIGHEKSRNRRLTGDLHRRPASVRRSPTRRSIADVIFAPLASDANNRVTRRCRRGLRARTRSARRTGCEIVAGLRFDSFKIDVDDLRASGGGEFRPHRPSLVAAPRHCRSSRAADLSIYASYSRSYLPQSGDQFSSLTVDHRRAEARAVRQLRGRREAGSCLAACSRPPRSTSSTEATRARPIRSTRAYRAHRQAAQPRPRARPRAQRHQPLADLGRLHAAEGGDHQTTRRAGRARSAARPRHSFSLWNRYDFTEQLGVGLGVIARSKSYATISNAVKLPGYARVDAALFYKLPGRHRGAAQRREPARRALFPDARTTTTISRPARRGRSRRRSATGSSRPAPRRAP